MADYHNPSDGLNGSKANDSNGLESLQSQLDAFLEQEKKAATRGAERGSNEQQQRLDHFINNLQRKLDAFMEENPTHASELSVSDSAVGEQEAVQVQSPHSSSRIEKIPAQLATTNPDFELPVMPGSANPVSYSRLIVRVLIGASCATAIVLWLFWPIEQTSLPLLDQQQRIDEHQPLPAKRAPESVADNVNQSTKPAVEENHATGLSQPVVAAQTRAKRQLDVRNVKLVVQPKSKPNMTEKMRVAVRLGNIRNKPDRSGKVLHRLVRGAVVTRLAEQGDWFQVRLRSGAIAWGHRSIFEPAH